MKEACLCKEQVKQALGPVQLSYKGVPHPHLPRSPAACEWHGKVCLTKLPVTHFLSRPCTCTTRDVMAGFPLGLPLLSTLPVWYNAQTHECVYMRTSISVPAQTSHCGAVVNAALHPL